MRFAVVIVMLGLAGCADVQNRLTDIQATYHNDDDNECRSNGVTVGTEPYFQCRMNLAQTRLDAEAAAREAKRNAAAIPPSQPQ
jgi:hypothetical protein